MALRKLICAPTGIDSPAADQLDGRMIPALEIDDATGQIYSGGLALSAGGSSLIQKATVTLTANQIKALADTPITIIAAPGVGKTLFPLSVMVQYKFGTVDYDGGTGIGATLFLGPIGLNNTFFPQNVINSAVFGGGAGASNFVFNVSGTEGGAPSNFENLSLQANAASNFTGGNGTVTVTVNYTVVDLS